jgi:hypothetical protein
LRRSPPIRSELLGQDVVDREGLGIHELDRRVPEFGGEESVDVL